MGRQDSYKWSPIVGVILRDEYWNWKIFVMPKYEEYAQRDIKILKQVQNDRDSETLDCFVPRNDRNNRSDRNRQRKIPLAPFIKGGFQSRSFLRQDDKNSHKNSDKNKSQ